MNTPKPQRTFTPAEIRATQQKVGAAGLGLVVCAPHFGLAWGKMRPMAKVPGPTQQGTWEVDRRGVMWVDPEFTATLSIDEAVFVLAHEIMHVLCDHQGRSVALGLRDERGYTMPGQNLKLRVWGIAADMAINHALKKDNIGKCPASGALPPKEYITAGLRLDAESIYYWLLQRIDEGGGASFMPDPDAEPMPTAGCLPVQGETPAPGAGEPDEQGVAGKGMGNAPGMSPEEVRQMRREVELTAQQMGGRLAGKGSAVAELLAPTPSKMDWRRLCRQGMEHVDSEAEERSVRTYARLPRRPGLSKSILRPGRIGTSGTLAAVCDVSGSISRETVRKIAGHMLRICSQFPTVKVIFVAHTDRVEYSKVLKPGGSVDDIMEGLKHSGGTAAQPAYDEVKKLAKGKPVDTLIHFTDCYIEDVWPVVPAKQLVIGKCGDGQRHTEPPPKARMVPVDVER